MGNFNTLKKEIILSGLNGNSIVGVNKLNGECLISNISINELICGKYEYLMHLKVKQILSTPEGLVFVLNTNVIKDNSKNLIYRELIQILEDFENMKIGESELYEMLLKIKENWKNIIK